MLDLSELDGLPREALLATWEQVFARPVPRHLSQAFLKRFIAFEQQAKRKGGLTRGFLEELQKAANPARQKRSPGLKPGGRLMREWNGKTYVVDVKEDSFVCGGQQYASLSAVARAITGARWSGPRFFGLKEGGVG